MQLNLHHTFGQNQRKIDFPHLAPHSGEPCSSVSHSETATCTFAKLKPPTQQFSLCENCCLHEVHFHLMQFRSHICIKYTTTNRDGYREYKSNPDICIKCPSRHLCTESKNRTKVVIHHIWAEYMEMAEDVRHSPKGKVAYLLRKETVERVFADDKEKHVMRYTHYRGLVNLRSSKSENADFVYLCCNEFKEDGKMEA